MKHCLFLSLLLLPFVLLGNEAAQRLANTVVLDAGGVKNLRIETQVIMPGDFEETIFALGRIEVYPGRREAISSRIAGRAVEVLIKPDHAVQKGEPALVIESRQVGNPPPKVTLNAPISGIVSAVNVIAGQPVGPDDTLAEILDLTEVYAFARVPEHLAGKLRIGQRAHISVAAASGETFSAELEHLGAIADPSNGTIEAAFQVANPGLKLRPGMRAEFSIVVSKKTEVNSVPRTAIQGTPSNRFVYVKDFDLPNAFVKTPVVTGQSNDRFVEIVSGLFPADEVVVQGAYSLAFAGGGTISLKEALDAAHGHEHNPDGSEISSSQKKATSGESDSPSDAGNRFWMLLSGVLFIALVIAAFRKPRQR